MFRCGLLPVRSVKRRYRKLDHSGPVWRGQSTVTPLYCPVGQRASNLWAGYAGLMSTLLWLFLAASLEAGGDAIVRAGLGPSGTARIAWFVAGAIVLFSYGYTVNTPKWDFGRLLGVYVTLFFLVAQLIGWIFFHESPSRSEERRV